MKLNTLALEMYTLVAYWILFRHIIFILLIFFTGRNRLSVHVVLYFLVIANTGNVIHIEIRLYYKGCYDSIRNY